MRVLLFVVCLLLAAITWPVSVVVSLAFFLFIAFLSCGFDANGPPMFSEFFTSYRDHYYWWKEKIAGTCTSLVEFVRQETKH